jgi:PilZ domain
MRDSISMPYENGAGASYLASLRQTRSPHAAATKPAPIPLSPVLGTVKAAGTTSNSEKRKSLRYRCQGSVHLREATSKVATWATLTDISLNGCYVEASAGYGVGANLNLAIEVNGLRFESSGEVRAAYPGLGMGISFTGLSVTNGAQLRKLIESISKGSRGSGPRFAMQTAPPPLESPVSVSNPGAVLQAMQQFFEDRHLMGREEFLRILQNHR